MRAGQSVFYYNKNHSRCLYLGKHDGVIIAKDLITKKLFEADPDKIEVRRGYSLKVMAYIDSCQTVPSPKQISCATGMRLTSVYKALRAAKPEIDNFIH